jgi:C-terminal processing protease CtpA/Prc
MAVRVDVDGFLNPTLKAVTISKVEPHSPAARGMLAVDDQIVEVEGHGVAGSRAKEIEPLMRKAVDAPLHLRLKRANGQFYDVVLVAAAQPK